MTDGASDLQELLGDDDAPFVQVDALAAHAGQLPQRRTPYAVTWIIAW